MNVILCFTDASYSPQNGKCVIGYKISNNNIVLQSLTNVKNTQAELLAIERCISDCRLNYPHDVYHIHTDCQKAITYFADEYDVVMIKVDGHKKGCLRDDIDDIFRTVDLAVRKKLRHG